MDPIVELFKTELNESKTQIKDLEKRVQDLETSDKLQNREIESINSALADIKDDTKFIRRTVQGAVISCLLTLIVGVIWATLIK